MKLLKSLSTTEKMKIRKAVEVELEKYRFCKSFFVEKEVSITTSYDPRYHGQTNTTTDQTASAAIHNVDDQRKRTAFCKRIDHAVNRLPEKERFLITERYMSAESDYISDMMMYCFKFNPPISHPTYGKIKDRAMYKLVLILGIDCGVDLLSEIKKEIK